jgi:hypothetical protein
VPVATQELVPVIPERPEEIEAMPPYVCLNPDTYLTKVVGNGQCVVFVKVAAGAPETSAWMEGTKIKKGDPPLPKGTAIATFVNGKYPNHQHGNHAAIYIGQNNEGIQVYDQWAKTDKKTGAVTYHPVTLRTIHFHVIPGHSLSDNGNAFSVIK